MPEKLILQILETGELPVGELLLRLRQENYFDDAEAKAAIWRLISQSAVQLTDANTLRAVPLQFSAA